MAKKALTWWTLAYVLGGVLMVATAHYASSIISLGR